jgi:alginate O-acetyltransferase complex protein AlgI
MLLGGLWHGASWTFVVWGGLHGIYLAIERLCRGLFGNVRALDSLLARIGLALVTYFMVNITWVFFRAQEFSTAWRMIKTMLLVETGGFKAISGADATIVSVVIAAMLAVHWSMRERTLEDVVARTPWWLVASVWAVMLAAIAMTQGGGDAFIYFQF